MSNKYFNKKTFYNGRVYDSKFEAKKAAELKLQEQAGLIKNLQTQVKFLLQDGYINNQGKKIRPIYYIADFVFYNIKEQKNIVMDTKSPATKTETYKIKKKLFEYKYKDYFFIETFK